MPVTNSDVTRIFNQVADLLELQDANPFRVRSYREAARTIRSLSRDVRDMIERDEDLTELAGIGDDLAGKIRQIVETGELELLQELRERTPLELTELMRIEGLGPKRVKKLHDELGIVSLEELERAAREQRIRALKGFGEKIEQNILDELRKTDRDDRRTPLLDAERVARPLVDYLRALEHAERVEVAGSYRRRRETVGDLDILVISDRGEETAAHFVDYEDVAEVVSRGETRSTVLLRSGMQVDLRVVSREHYGAALMYFTGSKSHNIALRNIAVEESMKINEYGVFDGEGTLVGGKTEEEIYELFDCAYIAPELRENRGEIEAAREGTLPELVRREDLRGDLQSHTTASDGRSSLEAMARAARECGHDYLAVTDHSEHLGITTGLDADRLREQAQQIDALNEQFDDFRLLKGSEVDITRDGSLALPTDVLEPLDVVLVAVHSHFDLSEKEQTDRVIRALRNDCVDILAHPTARLIGGREPIDLDLEAVVDAALETGCFLEINAQPDRLDLNDAHAKLARDRGLRLSISTDAHDARNLDTLRFGVDQARRGWLEADDVINTLPLEDLLDLFHGGSGT